MTDVLGKRFGRLTVAGLARTGTGRLRRISWECRCDCGNVIVTQSSNVRNGHTSSCGCLNRELLTKTHRRHGKSRHPLYMNWQVMIQRCENPKCAGYPNYGGRGIKVCDRWKVWENFYADMGDRPSPDHSIDRIDNNGNYEPDNCRWATRTEQASNKRPYAEWKR